MQDIPHFLIIIWLTQLSDTSIKTDVCSVCRIEQRGLLVYK